MPPEPRRRTTCHRPINAPGPRLLGVIDIPAPPSIDSALPPGVLRAPAKPGLAIGEGVPAATAPADDSLVDAPGERVSTAGSAAIAGTVLCAGLLIMPIR